MNRLLALAMLLVLPSFSRADAGLPFLPNDRYVPVTITLTVDRNYPDHEIFLVGGTAVQRIVLSPSNPVVFRSDEDPLRPTMLHFTVYAVPRDELDRLGQPIPKVEWFNRMLAELGNGFAAGSIGDRGRVGFDDDRKRVEKVYRLEILPEGSRVVLVSENAGSRWVKLGWTGFCCVLPPLAIAWFGFWFIRKVFRKMSSGGAR